MQHCLVAFKDMFLNVKNKGRDDSELVGVVSEIPSVHCEPALQLQDSLLQCSGCWRHLLQHRRPPPKNTLSSLQPTHSILLMVCAVYWCLCWSSEGFGNVVVCVNGSGFSCCLGLFVVGLLCCFLVLGVALLALVVLSLVLVHSCDKKYLF